MAEPDGQVEVAEEEEDACAVVLVTGGRGGREFVSDFRCELGFEFGDPLLQRRDGLLYFGSGETGRDELWAIPIIR